VFVNILVALNWRGSIQYKQLETCLAEHFVLEIVSWELRADLSLSPSLLIHAKYG
jgi:hypothetical protein